MRITRVLNSNAVVVDDGGKPAIVLGKGLGYGRRAGDEVDATRITQTFRPDESHSIDRLAAFLADVPLDVVRVAHEIAELAHGELGVTLSQALVLPLADHLAHVVAHGSASGEDHPLAFEVRQLYPREVAIGQQAIALVRQRLGVELPAAEAVSLALHLVNATFATDNLAATVGMTQRISQILDIVESALGVPLDRHSIGVARFVTHLRYLFVRLASGTAERDGGTTSSLVPTVAAVHPEAFACAQRVAYVLELTDGASHGEELLYLTLHIARLSHDLEASRS